MSNALVIDINGCEKQKNEVMYYFFTGRQVLQAPSGYSSVQVVQPNAKQISVYVKFLDEELRIKWQRETAALPENCRVPLLWWPEMQQPDEEFVSNPATAGITFFHKSEPSAVLKNHH